MLHSKEKYFISEVHEQFLSYIHAGGYNETSFGMAASRLGKRMDAETTMIWSSVDIDWLNGVEPFHEKSHVRMMIDVPAVGYIDLIQTRVDGFLRIRSATCGKVGGGAVE